MCDSTADVLSTGTSHPSARLSDAVLDVGHDDYYDHNGSWWDIRDSGWLVHLDSPPGLLTDRGRRHGRRRHLDSPTEACATTSCTKRYDGGTAVRLVAVEHTGYRLLVVGWRLLGNAVGSCDTTVQSDGVAVTATFGPAVTVTARTRGPGHITQLDGTPCAGECDVGSDPGLAGCLRRRARTRRAVRRVGADSAVGREPTCTVAVSLDADRPSVTAVFRDVRDRPRSRAVRRRVTTVLAR